LEFFAELVPGNCYVARYFSKDTLKIGELKDNTKPGLA